MKMLVLALALFLGAAPALAQTKAVDTVPAELKAGEAKFKTSCSGCHGERGSAK